MIRMRFRNIALGLFVLVAVPVYWITMVMNSEKSCSVVLEERIIDLRDRLQLAETSNVMREREMKVLNDQINYLSKLNKRSNVSYHNSTRQSATYNLHYLKSRINDSSLYLPSIFSFLPHLHASHSNLRPAFNLSMFRTGVSMVFGVPTVKRDKESYLIQTLSYLVNGLDDAEMDDALIIVFIAEPYDMNYVKNVAQEIQHKFEKYLDSGLIEVISPPASYYPDFNKLKITLNDPIERVKWRTKQNLDFAFLMLYAKPRGIYYTQLEDDIVAKPRYSLAMKNFISQQKSDSWMMLEFSQLGFIGKTFKSQDLPGIVTFFTMFHNDKPVDWLLDAFFRSKYCLPEKPVQHCNKLITTIKLRYKPSLFQHVGIYSSLKGKVQKLKDKDFGKGGVGLVKGHRNPPAEVKTSLVVYQKYTLDRAYKGETIFWGVTPETDDILQFDFAPPLQSVKKFLFRTGNADHPGDIFRNTTIEVLPISHINDNGAVLENLHEMKMYPDAGKGFLIIGAFNKLGVCEGTVDRRLGAIVAIRLRVLSKSPSWVLLSETRMERIVYQTRCWQKMEVEEEDESLPITC